MAKVPKIPIRDVSPLLQKVRNFLLGRSHTLAVRFEDECATRSPELPNLPDGPSHKLSANYYCNRDARREVAPPLVLTAQQQIGEETKPKLITPGPVYRWD